MIRELLRNKPVYRKDNGDEILDLTKQTFHPVKSPVLTDYVIVTDDMIGRPDIISMFAYSSPDRAAMVLKQNNYSNPFAIDKGDIFFLQDLGEMSKQISNNTNETNIENFRNQYIDPSKVTQRDVELNRFENRDKTKTRRDGSAAPALPPNIANIGDKEFTIRGGKVIFGEDITNNTEVCDAPLSKGEFINRLLKNKLSDNNS